MNKWNGTGRAVRDFDIRYSQGDKPCCFAKGTVAVDRRIKKDGEPSADFINVRAVGKLAEFLEKYGRKGTKFELCGRIETGSYTNKDNQKVYTTEVFLEEVSFAESKKDSNAPAPAPAMPTSDEFMNIPDDIQEELPFV